MRWVFRLIGLVVVLVVVFVAGIFLVPADRIANLAAQQFEARTGRALTISGDVSPTLWPTIGARIEGVTLANIEGSDAGPMLSADSVSVGVDLAALIGGNVAIQRFEVRQPTIVLEVMADGRANWVFEGLGGGDTAATEPTEGGGLPAFTLDRALIEGASLRYIDHGAGTDMRIEGVSLDVTMPDSAGPVDLRITATRGGQEGSVQAQVGSLAGLLSGEVVAIAATLTAEGAEASFTGRAGLEPLAAEGRIALDARRLAPALALAGISGAEPLPEGARPLTVGGQVTLAPAGSVHLRDGQIGVGSSLIRTALDITLDGERPNITGEIAADALDLRPFTTGGDSAPSGGGGSGWPTTPIDASALGLFDARIGLTLGTVQTGFANLDAVRGALVVDRARAVIELAEVRAFDGRLSGELVANNRSGLSVGGNLQLRDVQMQPLLRQLAEFERLTGTASMDLRFLGVGQSMDAIMRSLSGQGRMDFGAGEIIGFDLAGMLRNLDLSYVGEGNRTIFQSLAGSYTIENGILRNDDLALTASLVSVLGQGVVDLGGQVLEYRVTPEAMRNAETGEAFSVPLMITGPWSSPRFRLDLEGLAEQRLAEERERLEAAARAEAARLEAEARARVEAEVEERLGITREEGQSAEDALRQGAEDALRSRLNRLLGGSEEAAPADPAPTAAPPEGTGAAPTE